MITRAEAVALTELLRTIRPAWDALTTVNILCALAGYDLADIAAAAIRTAQDPTMRQPQTLTFTDSQHWRPARNTAPTEALAEHEARIRIRQQAVAHCTWCDDRGYLNGYLCQHDNPTERAARVKAWADHARAQIRTIDTTTAHGTVAALTPDRDEPRPPNQQETA